MSQPVADVIRKESQTTKAMVQGLPLYHKYVKPVYEWSTTKYQQSGFIVKTGIVSFGALSAIPLICFVGFMALVTLGCLVVGGIALAVVESGFAMFGSAFLLPALGVATLVTFGVTGTAAALWGTFRVFSAIGNRFLSPDQKQHIEAAGKHAQMATAPVVHKMGVSHGASSETKS